MLGENRESLERIAMALLDRETITGADIDLLMKGESLPPMEPVNGAAGPRGADAPPIYNAEGKVVSAPGYKPVSEGDAKDDDFLLEEEGKDEGKKDSDDSGDDSGDDNSKLQ
jgi:cell division protease FtsH